jgi:integrase
MGATERATMALAFFCGVRVEEAGRLVWEDIDLNRRIIQIGHSQSKMGHRRVNVISDNAYEWLNLCKSTGRVAPQNHEERLKRLRRESGIKYPQNAMRHCFTSYHIAKHKGLVLL